MCKNAEMDTFDELKTSFQSGRTKDLRWRAEQLSAIERMMSERENELIDALRQDLGKPALESWMTEMHRQARSGSCQIHLEIRDRYRRLRPKRVIRRSE